MIASNRPLSLEKLRARIGKTIRGLRRGRRWTQAELSERLGVSQSRLSEIESGASSLTAEQFLLILGLFNVGASQFSGATADPEGALQNALGRLGADHLQESAGVVPSAELDDLQRAIRAGLTSASPRLIAALAPVLVRQIDRIDFRKLRADLVETGFAHRLDWLLENTREALQAELGTEPPPIWAKRYRRALIVLESALRLVTGQSRVDDSGPPDILDAGIRSRQTLSEVRASASSISARWGIVTALHPKHFADALRGAREAG